MRRSAIACLLFTAAAAAHAADRSEASFSVLDQDQDNRISAGEAPLSLLSFAQADLDGNGSIDRAEFARLRARDVLSSPRS